MTCKPQVSIIAFWAWSYRITSRADTVLGADLDIFDALSKAADITKPGVRDQLPVASVVFVAAALIAAGAPQQRPSMRQLEVAVEKLGGVGLTLLILAIVAASILLQPLTSFLEAVLCGLGGPRWLGWLTRRSTIRHQQRSIMYRVQLFEAEHALKEYARAARVSHGDVIEPDKTYERARDRAFLAAAMDAHTQEIRDKINRAATALRRYPRSKENIRATMLGNVLAAGEENAGGRYGLDTAVVLPRFEPVLPEATAQRVTGHRDDLRFAVRLASALIIAAIVSVILLVPVAIATDAGRFNTIWFCVTAGALLLAWSSYRSSVAAAVQYGEALAVAFDLDRFQLYEMLHLPLPQDPYVERQLAERLSTALLTGQVALIRYELPNKGSDKDDS